MKNLLETADEIPVTLLIALAYVTMAFLTDPFDPSFGTMRDHGALIPLISTESGCWRLLANTFLHVGLLHLIMNMLGLLSFGPSLERAIGSVRFAVLYLVSGLGGSLACCLLYDPVSYVAGGSGALFGLVGGVLAWQMRASRNPLAVRDFDGPRRLLGWIVFAFLFGILSPIAISNTAHAGGLVTGFAVTFLLLAPTRHAPGVMLQAWRVTFVALLVSVTLWAVWPFTRWDWLCQQAERSRDPARAQRLLRAAQLAAPREHGLHSPGYALAYWRLQRDDILTSE